jgi:spore coat polysaccharide biosynthesis protein SpsF (cytidylyltransferase family)
MTVVAVIQARTGSTRLPGKVLLPLAGAPALQRMIERVSTARTLDRVVVATTTAPGDDAVAALCSGLGVACVRGSETDVLARFALVVRTVAEDADHLVRLTGDCPLVDPDLVDTVVTAAVDAGCDYLSNVDPPSWPDGLDVEVMSRAALLRADEQAVLPSDREHVTPWLRRHGSPSVGGIRAEQDLSGLRWTLDEPEDYVLLAVVYAALHDGSGRFTTQDVLAYLRSRPELAGINARFARTEGYLRSLRDDPLGGATA